MQVERHETEQGEWEVTRRAPPRDPEGNVWHFGTYQPFAEQPAQQKAAARG